MRNKSSIFISSSIIASLLSFNIAMAGVTPASVDETLGLGKSVTVAKTVTTPPIPPKPDVIFLADTTGSMGPAIANVQSNAVSIMNSVLSAQPDAQFGVASYKDFNCDAVPYSLDHAVTASTADANTAIGTWSAAGGCDVPEAQINALYQIANDPATGFRTGSTRIVVWFGDATGHDPSNGHTQADAIAALNAADGVHVIAVPVNSGFGDGLDGTGQATAITAATGGSLQPSASPSDVTAAILAGLANLPVTVSWDASSCAPGLNISLVPASQTVTSGDSASFTETISVPTNPALLGTTQSCTVHFMDENKNSLGDEDISVKIPVEIALAPKEATNELIPGATHSVTGTLTSDGTAVSGATLAFNIASGPNTGATGSGATDALGQASFTYSATQGNAGLGTDNLEACFTNGAGTKFCDSAVKHWVDTTTPTASCVQTTNPSGKNVPTANKTNEDGYYQLFGTDNIALASIVVRDSGSSFVSNLFATGDKVKITQAPGVTPSDNRPGPGVIVSKLMLKGDAILKVTDTSGNTTEVACLVPPPPK